MIKKFKDWNESVEQIEFCNKFMGNRWKVNDKGEIVVKGDIGIDNFKGKELPVQFAITTADVRVRNCKNLETLKGVPRESYSFTVQNCPRLSSLVEGPDKVYEYKIFNCPKIFTIFGAPIIPIHSTYSINIDNIKNPIEAQWLKENNLEMIHLWLKSKLKIEDFLEKKRGMIIGKKYGI